MQTSIQVLVYHMIIWYICIQELCLYLVFVLSFLPPCRPSIICRMRRGAYWAYATCSLPSMTVVCSLGCTRYTVALISRDANERLCKVWCTTKMTHSHGFSSETNGTPNTILGVLSGCSWNLENENWHTSIPWIGCVDTKNEKRDWWMRRGEQTKSQHVTQS